MKRAHASLKRLSRTPWLILATLILFYAQQSAWAQTVCGVPGKDGAATISGIVNTYHQGLSTTSTSITVGSSRAGGASTPISAGDLLLVMQMQDAGLVSTNDANYGDGAGGNTGSGWSGLNSTGLYEYVVATSSIGLGGGTINIRGTGASSGLRNVYTNAAAGASGQKRFQVIRVPQYSTGTLGSVTAPAWDGSTGGIVAFDVAGALNLTGGSVNVTGLGFRGGGSRRLQGDKSSPMVAQPIDHALSSTYPVHGSKGEGIAGTPHYVYNAQTGQIDDTLAEGYPGGSHARGAPGNAGGGGTDSDPNDNQENSGGGGGSNGGAGGKGGRTWSGDADVGGYGGASFAGSVATNRIIMGGGGGGGTKNNDTTTAASTGAAGGGIVMIRAGSYSGSAAINANGANAYDDTLNDGGGGGGAGGSVIVMGGSGQAGFTINVNGGNGGDAWRSEPIGANPPTQRHGPGGGGGGGIVYYSGGAGVPTVNRNGGDHGITTTSSSTYGSQDGNDGPAPATIAHTSTLGASPSSACIPSLTTTKTTTTPNVTNSPTGTTATYRITVSNAANLGSPYQLNISDTLPTGFTYASTSSINYTGNATRDSVSNPTAGATSPSWGVFSIYGGGQVQITFTVNIARTVLSGTYQNPASATYLDPLRTLANPNNILSANYTAASSTGEDVTVASTPDMTIAKSHTGNFTQGQVGAQYTLTVTNSGSGQSSGVVTVTDTLPAGLTPTGVSAPLPWSCGFASQTVTCARSDALLAGNSYSAITITVDVSATAPASLTNTASVSGGGETNTGNNSGSDLTTINQLPDMTVVKTHTGNFRRGSSDTYTITVTNSGTVQTSANVTVTDTLPAGLTPTGWSGAPQWSCIINLQVVTCTNTNTLNAGVSYTPIGITVSVAQNAASSVTNTATVSGGGQVNTANDTSNDLTNIVSSSDLSLTKVTTNSGSGIGTNAIFTVTLTNAGPTHATNVAVRDQLPAGLAYISSTPSVGTYNSGTGVWAVGTLNSGLSATLVLTARIDAVGALTNTAQVSASDQPDPDSTPNNNNATEDDQASSGLSTSPPAVSLCKTIVGLPCPPLAPPTLPPGSDISYVLTFTNTGGTPATTFVITDPSLPPISTLKLNDYTYFKVGSETSTLPAGLSISAIWYSDNNGATWTYTPTSGADGAPAGYDARVTHIRWEFSGSLSQQAPNNTGSVSFTVRIK